MTGTCGRYKQSRLVLWGTACVIVEGILVVLTMGAVDIWPWCIACVVTGSLRAANGCEGVVESIVRGAERFLEDRLNMLDNFLQHTKFLNRKWNNEFFFTFMYIPITF
jgi:hypothetical protein